MSSPAHLSSGAKPAAPVSVRGSRGRVAARSGGARRAKVEAQKASLADHVAKGGSVTGWGRLHGVHPRWPWLLWAKIRWELGGQAI